MKYKYLIIIISLFVTLIACKSSNENESGPTSWSVYIYDNKFGKFSDDFSGRIEFEIVNDGKWIEANIYDSTNSLVFEVTNDTSFFSKDRLLDFKNSLNKFSRYPILLKNYDKHGSLAGQIITKFDSNNLKTRKETLNEKGLLQKLNIYDDLGHIIEKTTFDSSGSVDTKRVNKFNNDNCVEAIIYNSSGHIEEKRTRSYDIKGNKIEDISLDGDGSIISKFNYTYDSLGTLTNEVSYYKTKNNSWEKVSNYDSRGNLIEEKSTLFDYHRKYKYDKNNRLVEEIVINTGSFSSYSMYLYTYDDNGKLTEKNEIEYDSPRLVEKHNYDSTGRKIEELSYDYKNEIKQFKRWKYDLQGRLIEHEEKGLFSGYLKNTYKYDNKNRLSEIITFDELNEPKKLFRIDYDDD